MPTKRCIAAIFLCLTAQAGMAAETSVRSADPASACHDQEVKMLVWESQGIVSSIDYGTKPPLMRIDWRRWMTLPQKTQEDIAISAYCRNQLRDPDGTLDVGTGSSLLGSVTKGRWHNRLTGE